MHATLHAYEAGSAGRHEQHLSCVSITRKDSDGSHMRCTTRYVQRGGFRPESTQARASVSGYLCVRVRVHDSQAPLRCERLREVSTCRVLVCACSI